MWPTDTDVLCWSSSLFLMILMLGSTGTNVNSTVTSQELMLPLLEVLLCGPGLQSP